MPYITKEQRAKLDPLLKPLANMILGPGQLNYVITQLLLLGASPEGWNYADINERIGVLECAKMEFYRKLAAPYENGKASANGDVYEESVRKVIDKVFPAHRKVFPTVPPGVITTLVTEKVKEGKS